MIQKLKIIVILFISSISWTQDCCEEAEIALDNCGGFGCYIPQCTEECMWEPMQCWGSTGYCWCVDENGVEIEGTSIPSWQGLPDCEEHIEECFDFSGIDFGPCAMVLGVGLMNEQCSYVSGCSWIIDDIDYSDLFFDNIEECQETCGNISSTVTDIDGNVYETIQIGNQMWMAENLKVTHYNNGDSITYITSEEHWGSMDEGQYAIYNDEPTNANIYGNLYNWPVTDDARGVCPVGWHVPSDDEFSELIDFLGGESVAGGKMKEAGLDHWDYYSEEISLEATNESGFTGLPAGHRNTNTGDCIYMGTYGFFWSSTETSSDLAWRRYLIHYSSGVGRDTFGKPNGFSIRCVSDNYILGDINFDGNINVLDVVLLVSFILGESVDEFEYIAADINEDNSLNVLDVVMIIEIILNQVRKEY